MPSLTETIAIAMDQAARGRIAQAIDDLKRQLPAHPDSAELHQSLGILALRHGQLDQGFYHFERSASLGRPRADYLANYATALNLKGRYKESVEQYKKAAQLSPGFFPAQLGLASALMGVGQYAEAEHAARAAVAIVPGRPEAWNNLGLALMRSGRTAEAAATMHQALASLRDHPLLLSVLVQTLNHRPEADPQSVLEEHQRLARILQQLAGGLYPTFDNPDPDRPLRVGYISQDFRESTIARFIEPVLASHTLETFCYSAVLAPDATTKRLQKLPRHWTDVSRMMDDQLERTIRADKIDILVDLSGHTTGSRIAAFPRRLAPVQISWLGYPNTTALKDMDYRLVDARTDPEGAETHATEKPLRLDGTAFCWSAPADAPAVTPRAAGPITFGSFAPAAAMNESTIELWSRILTETPGSRLILKNTALGSPATQDYYRAQFAKHNIAADRLEFLGHTPALRDHLAAHARIDIALDPFPGSALGATCDALYMGIPVISLEGRTHASRRSASALAAAGLTDLIATSTDDYAAKARSLAADPKRLADLRASLRERTKASALCDAKAFTAKLESAYRDAWRTWCAKQS